jgi:hypothetical protein
VKNVDNQDQVPPGLRIAPISSELHAGSPLWTLAMALPLWLLLLLGMVGLRSSSQAETSGAPVVHSVAMILDYSDFPQEPPPPPPVSLDKDETESLGSGEGHINGTDTVDPSLQEVPPQRESGINVLPQMLVPEVPPTYLPSVPMRTDYRTDLPQAVGGNGAAQGTGRDSGRGLGGWGSRRARTIHPIHKVKPVYPTREIDYDASKVLVKLLINQKGRVLSAEAESGPQKYYEICVKAARNWVFFIPKEMASQAPFTWYIGFTLDTEFD